MHFFFFFLFVPNYIQDFAYLNTAQLKCLNVPLRLIYWNIHTGKRRQPDRYWRASQTIRHLFCVFFYMDFDIYFIEILWIIFFGRKIWCNRQNTLSEKKNSFVRLPINMNCVIGQLLVGIDVSIWFPCRNDYRRFDDQQCPVKIAFVWRNVWLGFVRFGGKKNSFHLVK